LSREAYYIDTIPALDAKFEAQKISFAPLTFQAVRAMLELGVLRCVSDAAAGGISLEQLARKTGVSPYGVAVLAEIALGMGVFKLRPPPGGEEERYTLGKTGWFLLEDAMTAVNFNFVHDVCYEGAFHLAESIRKGRPEGLAVFGSQWKTVYEALASLPEPVRHSWFAFDHYYSDIAFPEALPIVFNAAHGASPGQSPCRMIDIGGNTAKWAIACCRYHRGVEVTIVDLPGQIAVAQQNAAAAGFAGRISVHPADILRPDAFIPPGADAVWMSQFLDCFAPAQITGILRKVALAVTPAADVWVLEPLWDMQRFDAAAYALQASSLYFTCIANGTSKMYRFGELNAAIEQAGFTLKTAHHNLGTNSYSLLQYRRIP
jgi:hypothetical protein